MFKQITVLLLFVCIDATWIDYNDGVVYDEYSTNNSSVRIVKYEDRWTVFPPRTTRIDHSTNTETENPTISPFAIPTNTPTKHPTHSAIENTTQSPTKPKIQLILTEKTLFAPAANKTKLKLKQIFTNHQIFTPTTLPTKHPTATPRQIRNPINTTHNISCDIKHSTVDIHGKSNENIHKQTNQKGKKTKNCN
eukprot:72441_1